MRRTQLYLDENLWNALHVRARSQNTTISELVREAIRERYIGKQDQRVTAMRELVGIRKSNRTVGIGEDVGEYVRSLRRGSRLDRLNK